MKRGLWLAFPVVVAMGCGGGGGGTPPATGGTGNADASLYAQAVQDYNGKAYSTAKAEFQQLLGRTTATAYYDKATIFIAAIDFYQGGPATCLAVLGSPTPPTSGFFSSYPASTDLDRARYWHGRCSLGLTPADHATARADFTAVIGMSSSTYVDNAYLWRGRSYYATALASGSEVSGDWTSALSDFTTVVAAFGKGSTAPEAQYWLGRTHFAKGNLAKGRGTVPGDTLAKAELASADIELKKQLSTYPTTPPNGWIPDVSVYLGRTHFEQAAYATDKVAAYTVAVNDLLPLLGTSALIRDEANYWYGRALQELGLAHETTAPPDYAAAKTQLDAAVAQLQKFQGDVTLSTSKLADNASYWVGRCLFSLADLLKVQAAVAADFANAQAAFAAAQAQLVSTTKMFVTSNVLDLVQVYLGRAQFEQGVCAQAQGATATSLYAGAQTAFTDYFANFKTVLSSTAGAHYWRGRTYQAQANPTQAITEFNAVVSGWDYAGIATPTKPATTSWWDHAQDGLVRASSDLATTTSCAGAQTAYDALKAAIPTDPLLASACTYMQGAGRCPGNVCP
jgi:TolA-binding protein